MKIPYINKHCELCGYLMTGVTKQKKRCFECKRKQHKDYSNKRNELKSKTQRNYKRKTV